VRKDSDLCQTGKNLFDMIFNAPDRSRGAGFFHKNCRRVEEFFERIKIKNQEQMMSLIHKEIAIYLIINIMAM
jgi:hypothetical protein